MSNGERNMHKTLRNLCLSLILLPLGSAFAMGMLELVAPDTPNLVGLGVGALPDYYGSNDYTAGAAPMVRYQFDGTERFLFLVANELDINLVNHPVWQAGPVLNYNFGRSNVDDPVVSEMQDLGGYLEYGAFLRFVYVAPNNSRNRWSVGVTGLTNSKSGNDGYRVRVAAQILHQVSPTVDINTGGGLWYADENWNDYHFGVNPGNVGTSGLPYYTAGGGVDRYYVNLGAIKYLGKSWALGAGILYANIPGDAGDSPLAGGQGGRGSTNQWTGGIGASYIFW
jgi:outer membrane protein